MVSSVPAWLQVASAVAVPTIAIFVAAISFFQWRTNKQSLDERLFDRRLKVYHDTKEFLLDVRRLGSLSTEGDLTFANAIDVARFLFDDRLVSRLTEIQKKGRYIRDVDNRLASSPDQWSDDLQDRVDAARDYLLLAESGLTAEFARYLGFNRRWSVFKA